MYSPFYLLYQVPRIKKKVVPYIFNSLQDTFFKLKKRSTLSSKQNVYRKKNDKKINQLDNIIVKNHYILLFAQNFKCTDYTYTSTIILFIILNVLEGVS